MKNTITFARACSSIALSTCLASAACADDPLTRLRPQIEVEPAELDFGDGYIGLENPLELTILNRGMGILDLTGFEIEGSSAFTTKDAPMKVGAIAQRKMTVVFTPARPHEVYDAVLKISSSDEANPVVSVPLHGVGGVQQIEVFPLELDFGVVNEGTAPRRQIEIRNIGKDTLRVSNITWTSTSVDMGIPPDTFTMGDIPVMTSTVVEVRYSPVDLGADFGTVTISSNDEDTADMNIDVAVRGRANLAPRALAWACEKPLQPGQVGCDNAELLRSLTASFRRIVGIDGRQSYDPEGAPIADYRWVIVEKPQGSNAAIFFSTSDIVDRRRATGDIEVDRVGTYDLRLIAKDDRGLESLDREESHVFILPRDLEVLLRWDFATDVDLHFVRPGGIVGDYGSGTRTSTGADCSAFNRTPNWSDLMNMRDDPSLDKDDVTGRGPEIISLDFPEDGGAYTVFAHYCDSRMTHASVNVVLEVYVRGELVKTVPDNGAVYPMASSELWKAAEVTWNAAGPSVSVTDLSMTAPTLEPGLCLSP